MKKTNSILLLMLFLIGCPHVSAQNSPKSFSKGPSPDSEYNNTFVYLHTDRSYYLPGESVFFKAYLSADSDKRSDSMSDTLHIALLDQEGLEVASGLFTVDNSLIKGNIDLPSFLTEGNYMLIAYTNLIKNLSPEKIFSRVLLIKRAIDDDLITDLSLSDTLYEPESLFTAKIRLSLSDNKPVTANFTYQVTGMSGEILNGKGKTDNEGTALLSFKLPDSASKENITLLVTPSYKGSKTITGIVIPTHFNYKGRKTDHDRNWNLQDNVFKHLNVQLKTTSLSNEEDNKIRLDISVTDDQGKPVMANLSVSASNIINNQHSSDYKNIVFYTNQETGAAASGTDQNIRKYFTQKLLMLIRAPGSQYVVQEKNNPKKLNRKENSLSQKKQYGYSGDRNIFDILMQIKPYHLEAGKIVFGINLTNTVNSPDGALIVVDGIKMGTEASILNDIPVPDISRITASTNVLDIQKYSAMNSMGVIEITMKKTESFIKREENAGKSKSGTLFWGPDIITDSSGNASISFFNNNKTDGILISVEGVAANGLSGGNEIQYPVK